MKWIDVEDIAFQLRENHPHIDPKKIQFTKLQSLVLALDGFSDDVTRCNEKILEAVQAAWISELE